MCILFTGDLMRKLSFILYFLLIALLLCACGGGQPAPAPVPEPAPSPTPTPPSAIVLTDESAEEILALAQCGYLRHIDASASREYDALLRLYALLPDCEIRWNVEFQGETYPSDTEELIITDPEGAADALPYLPGLKTVDMTACTLSVEEMEALSDLRPDVDFIWTLRFGEWTVRSDITCFSTLRTGTEGSHRYSAEELYPLLRFCRHLRALDLGHNDLTDIRLIGEMKELQVLILADNPNLVDISPLAALENLQYLELFLCWDIADFSPLENLRQMQDLNLAYCRNLEDISFINNMPDFENGWFRSTKLSREDILPYAESRPEITFVYGSPSDISAVCCGWRSTERNIAIRHAFTNWRQVVDYRHWDDIEYSG